MLSIITHGILLIILGPIFKEICIVLGFVQRYIAVGDLSFDDDQWQNFQYVAQQADVLIELACERRSDLLIVCDSIRQHLREATIEHTRWQFGIHSDWIADQISIGTLTWGTARREDF